MIDADSPKLSDFISPETMESMPFPVGVYDRSGLLIAINAPMEALMGISREDIVGRLRLDNFRDNPEFAAALVASRRALAGEVASVPPTRVDLRNVDLLGGGSRKIIWFDSKYFPLRNAAGEVCFLMLVSSDQTALMEERQAARAAQAEIAAQRETILALSSPVIEVWRGVLALPVIGHIDTARAMDMMSRLLEAIARTRSRFAILDLTGVLHVDTQTAESFMRILRSVELLGAQGLLVGIQPAISRALAELDIDTAGLRSFRTLGDALGVCLCALGAFPARS